MQDDENSVSNQLKRTPWNKCKLIGPKPPLRPKHVRGVLTATIQLFSLNSIAGRHRTASSWGAAGRRWFTVRASINVSPYDLVVVDTEQR
jgi:hypothetical protein